MKVTVVMVGVICVLLAIVFLRYGVQNGLIEKKMMINHYTKTVTGQKAVQTGIFYIIIGLTFLVGAVFIFLSLYLKIINGEL